MSEITESERSEQVDAGAELEFATFYIGEMLVGVNIQQVQEINRQLDVTAVPHAAECVRGVVNLRGEVVTVVDLRMVLGLGVAQITAQSRNVIVKSQGEQVGLLVDRIADVVTASASDIEPPPANVRGVDGRFFKGVFSQDGQLLVILDTSETLAVEADTR